MTGKQLKTWRGKLGLTQKDAAAEFGITPQHYREMESGRSPIRRVYEMASVGIQARMGARNETKAD